MGHGAPVVQNCRCPLLEQGKFVLPRSSSLSPPYIRTKVIEKSAAQNGGLITLSATKPFGGRGPPASDLGGGQATLNQIEGGLSEDEKRKLTNTVYLERNQGQRAAAHVLHVAL